jgi:hypothetical protein
MRFSQLTFLAFELNAQLDAGHRLDYAETRQHIELRDIFQWLKRELPDLDLSIIVGQPEEGEIIEDVWYSLWNAVDARRKFGVQNNGLCLLLAYTIEMIQNPPFPWVESIAGVR